MILNNMSDNYFFPFVYSEKIQIQNVFAVDNKCITKKIIHRILWELKIGYGYCFGDWFLNLHRFEKIIVFDNAYCKYLKDILKQYSKRKYLYIWNPAERFFMHSKRERLEQIFDKIYCFDENDAERFKIYYLHTIYTDQIRLKRYENKYDICFIGSDKNRKEYLKKLYDKFSDYGLKCKFYIYTNKDNEKNGGWEEGQKWISYVEYLKWVSMSKCILDITQEGQIGFTMRVMESVFFRKKLITNNKKIMESEIYRPKNIFILNENNWKDIKLFVDEKYDELDEELISKYNIENWVKKIY